ncbi:MAG: hypothetical protein ACK4TR_09005 [Phenylobacterium sp.]|uniref:hypothetical protein n=1 Tax=Phenylobacterium sp. TaxID=1871053 RepID=UPI0039197F29
MPISTPAIRGLLARALQASDENDGLIPTDIEMALAAEGYDLDRLEGDLELIRNNSN